MPVIDIRRFLHAASAVVPHRIARQRVDVTLIKAVVVRIEGFPRPFQMQFQIGAKESLQLGVGRPAPVAHGLIEELRPCVVHAHAATRCAVPQHARGVALDAIVPTQRRGAADHPPTGEVDIERHAAVPEERRVTVAGRIRRVTHGRDRGVESRVRRIHPYPLDGSNIGQSVCERLGGGGNLERLGQWP